MYNFSCVHLLCASRVSWEKEDGEEEGEGIPRGRDGTGKVRKGEGEREEDVEEEGGERIWEQHEDEEDEDGQAGETVTVEAKRMKE